MSFYHRATFLKSAADICHLPEDTGYEVAFAGRSNAGKSTALNVLTGIKNLAKTSKTPGRTQLINLFTLDEERRLVDLPGYGYAKVPQATKKRWEQTLEQYLKTRACLRGVVLLMDCRHPLKDLDTNFIAWSTTCDLPLHIVLTKGDKLSKSALQASYHLVKKHYEHYPSISVQTFSALHKTGVEALITTLNDWFAL